MKIDLYTKDNCPFCDRAKLLLNARKMEYTAMKIGEEISREDFVEKFPDVRSAPLVVIDDEVIGGFVDLMNYLENIRND